MGLMIMAEVAPTVFDSICVKEGYKDKWHCVEETLRT